MSDTQGCPNCGYRADLPSTNKGWEQNNVYFFNVYPFHLVVVTSAHLEAFNEAVETFANCEGKNIETILAEMGYSAMVARKGEEIREFTL